MAPNATNNRDFAALHNSISIPEINLGEFVLYDGYQSLYKILCIEILDPKGQLQTLTAKLHPYVTDPGFKERKFQPHLTLAYVNSAYELPEEALELEKTIKVENRELCLT